MKTVLFVKANDRADHESVSVQLYNAFLSSYQKSHTDDHIIELDLYQEPLPYMNAHLINGRHKKRMGKALLTAEEKITSLAEQYVDQFIQADKMIIAFPLWNLSIPGVLHTYLNYLILEDKTIKTTDNEGPVGLLTSKKAALLNARGGIYSEDPMASIEMSVNYVKNIMNLIGIRDISTVIIEGHHSYPHRASEIIQKGLQEAEQLAIDF